jgi:pimeloyl-ACP methyl ester carboxylesterase
MQELGHSLGEGNTRVLPPFTRTFRRPHSESRFRTLRVATDSRPLLDWPGAVVALARHLGWKRFAVAGISGGGPHAFASGYGLPDRVAVVTLRSSVAPFWPGALEGMLATTRRGFQLARWAPGLLTLVARRAISRREQFLGKLRRELPECDRRILARPEVARVLAENYGDALSTDEMAREMVLLRRQRGFAVSDIRVPVELWHGELDRNVPVAHDRRMAAAIANCRTHFIADAGHYVFFDELEFVLAPIAAI